MTSSKLILSLAAVIPIESLLISFLFSIVAELSIRLSVLVGVLRAGRLFSCFSSVGHSEMEEDDVGTAVNIEATGGEVTAAAAAAAAVAAVVEVIASSMLFITKDVSLPVSSSLSLG